MSRERSNQLKRERKVKRRAKDLRERDEKYQRGEFHRAMTEYLTGVVETNKHVPDRNDRAGWEHHLTLTVKNVLKEAQRLFPTREREFIRFFEGNPKDVGELSAMFTDAAQSLCCSVPFFMPFGQAAYTPRGTLIRISMYRMKSIRGKEGWVWYPDIDRSDVVIAGAKFRHFVYTPHALDRLKERLALTNMNGLGRIAVLCSLGPTIGVYCGGQWLVPLISAFEECKSLVGYAPLDIQGHLAVATSFLLRGMRGTPEALLMEKAGMPLRPLKTIVDSFVLIKELYASGILKTTSDLLNPFTDSRLPLIVKEREKTHA